jgi:hypothetical protein
MTQPGNALVRYRVLEYIVREEAIDPLDKYVREYFERLGYSETCVRDVISRFLMAAMVTSDNGLTPDDVRGLPTDEVGTIRANDTGKAYFLELLNCEWYYISGKRAMVRRLPERVVSQVQETGQYYVTPSAFVDYLKEEERAENTRIRVWEGVHGQAFKGTYLTPPHVKARGKLFKKEKKNG